MADTQSQNSVILAHLTKVGPITPLKALRLYGIMRLSARIHDLRESGHFIVTNSLRVRGRSPKTGEITEKIVAQYSLVKAKAAA